VKNRGKVLQALFRLGVNVRTGDFPGCRIGCPLTRDEDQALEGDSGRIRSNRLGQIGSVNRTRLRHGVGVYFGYDRYVRYVRYVRYDRYDGYGGVPGIN
jgi:hypothetical protein